MLRYKGYAIVFQEVPNEISLAINISGCKHRCEECHSTYLWEDAGEDLIKDLPGIISYYKDDITCVCFMGGDHDIACLMQCADTAKKNGLKTCVYTGFETYEIPDRIGFGLLSRLDYIKTGAYIRELGGLDCESTNQQFFRVAKTESGHIKLDDITYKFR